MEKLTAVIADKLLQEVVLKATTSGGKGGQNVNKVATKVQLFFDIDKSSGLNDEQKNIIRTKLHNRISIDGVLRVSSSEGRTQGVNREEAKYKFIELIRKALEPKKKRNQTKPSSKSIADRLKKKKLHSEKKSFRSSRPEIPE